MMTQQNIKDMDIQDILAIPVCLEQLFSILVVHRITWGIKRKKKKHPKDQYLMGFIPSEPLSVDSDISIF